MKKIFVIIMSFFLSFLAMGQMDQNQNWTTQTYNFVTSVAEDYRWDNDVWHVHANKFSFNEDTTQIIYHEGDFQHLFELADTNKLIARKDFRVVSEVKDSILTRKLVEFTNTTGIFQHKFDDRIFIFEIQSDHHLLITSFSNSPDTITMITIVYSLQAK